MAEHFKSVKYDKIYPEHIIQQLLHLLYKANGSKYTISIDYIYDCYGKIQKRCGHPSILGRWFQVVGSVMLHWLVVVAAGEVGVVVPEFEEYDLT